MKSRSNKQLVIALTTKTFSIGYMGEFPLCVYADPNSYTGIETSRLKQKLPSGATTHCVHKIARRYFQLDRVYYQYLEWYNLYINNLPTEPKGYKGKIS